MGEPDFTRRQLLAGLATAGGIGAAVGTGTAAMVSDETVVRRSTIRTGRLDLSVEWETDGSSGTSTGELSIPVDLSADDPEQTVRLTVSLPDDESGNNPAYGWVRTSCPGDDVVGGLDLSLRYASCVEDCLIAEGSVADLASGVALDADGDATRSPGQQRCLEPTDPLDLELEVGVDDFVGSGSGTFTLEFVGTQCRSNDGATTPFSSTGDCTPSSDEPPAGVSFVAFATTDDDPIATDPSDVLTVTDRNSAGEPLLVDWETDADVDFVVVKAGTVFTIYDYRSATYRKGTAVSGDEDAAVPAVEPHQRNASRPVEYAADELGVDGYEPLASLKLEYEDGWEVDE